MQSWILFRNSRSWTSVASPRSLAAISFILMRSRLLAMWNEKDWIFLGVARLDLKSGNVIVTSDGRVKVLGFGLARPPTRRLSPRRRAPTRSPLCLFASSSVSLRDCAALTPGRAHDGTRRNPPPRLPRHSMS